MGQAEDEATLRAAGWVEDCSGQWNHAYAGDLWLPLWLATIFEGTRSMSPERRALAQRAVEACEKREAELAAMSPEDRDKAIQEWAERLAADVADLTD